MLKTGRVALDVFELPVYPLYTPQSLQYCKPSAFPKVLKLGNNDFTGEIPKEIGQQSSQNLVKVPLPTVVCTATPKNI